MKNATFSKGEVGSDRTRLPVPAAPTLSEISVSQQIGLHLTTIREFGTAHRILVQTLGLIFAKLLKLPNRIKPFERAGVGPTGPASGEGV